MTPEGTPEKKTKVCDHTSVGMIIRQEDKILLIERKLYPFGFAAPAGHVDTKGGYEKAAEEETREEVGLVPVSIKLLKEARKDNPCRREEGTWHNWKVFEVVAEGELKPSKDETKQAGFYSVDEIEALAERTRSYQRNEINEDEWQANPGLEPVWLEWFEELGII